ncbi:hypothetical protein A946_00180 [Methylacidiphilum kamchatkense Kam1]|uniref:Uncharacterized protein n=1 Tax=Methylacidiphilum kamchatkense Kam1 TaxID=1202785 RepID=A0A0C1RMC2_9BACT|nr:hypothetical protein [Methylacidiphilum kamchatkense]KIE59192.1 hypothetical protein A946_00180 [Methylacidiphilum kamchatkense Kam1]QDQ42851.1 hypothetical protein kam1_1636 [Methylacidiphilum kamchatkense Kam1]
MGRIGILVDGRYDNEVINALIKRQFPNQKPIIRKSPPRQFSKAIAILNANMDDDVDGFIWVTDAEQDDPDEL